MDKQGRKKLVGKLVQLDDLGERADLGNCT